MTEKWRCMNLLGWEISFRKAEKEALGAKIGWWYRIPGDSTDRIRLVHKKDPWNSKRCIRCQKEIRDGLVWDTHFVTIGLLNTFLDAPICTECGPDLTTLLDSFKNNISKSK